MKLRVILADDHRLFRHALRVLLEQTGDIEVVAEAANGRELLSLLEAHPADVVCMDIGMPGMNGVEATRQLRLRWPQTRVIGLSAFSDRPFVVDLLAAGAQAYVTKAEAGDELLLDKRLHAAEPQLTARERQVLQAIAEGHTSAAIAAQLFVASSTVEVHRRNIMRKLGLRNVADLTRYAIRHGISPNE